HDKTFAIIGSLVISGCDSSIFFERSDKFFNRIALFTVNFIVFGACYIASVLQALPICRLLVNSLNRGKLFIRERVVFSMGKYYPMFTFFKSVCQQIPDSSMCSPLLLQEPPLWGGSHKEM
ncbi:MAG: hypothetical protein IJD04_03035, partial [Desulfovibrionaceae bacterium]|nr:hypothetical protein [Desulfovibrionaceae bacterium]